MTMEICFRLESYDRNANFVNDAVVMPPALLPNWPASGFRQILTSHRNIMPPVLEGHIAGYFTYHVACDNLANGDIAALEKGQALVDGDRVETCSFCTVDDEVFFTGIVRAMMKKKVCSHFPKYNTQVFHWPFSIALALASFPLVFILSLFRIEVLRPSVLPDT